MAVPREAIENEISWFNQQVQTFKNHFSEWLNELGHTVDISEDELTKVEEQSGPYKVNQYIFQIDKELKISIKPFGIWIIGAKGRIDVSGPSGSEKFIFLSVSDLGMASEIKHSNGRVNGHGSHRLFKNVDEDNWYWYDDSSYRQVSKFSKEIIEPLLERLQ